MIFISIYDITILVMRMIYLLYEKYPDVYCLSEQGVHCMKDTHSVKFIDSLCLQYGSSYEGRKAACKRVCQIKQKVPILLSEKTKDILFPLSDIRKDECIWLNHRAIRFAKTKQGSTYIKFENETTITLHKDIRILKRQMAVCQMFLNSLS